MSETVQDRNLDLLSVPATAERRLQVAGRNAAAPVARLRRAALSVAEGLYATLEVTVSGLALLAALPVIATLAILVRIDSPGPPLFLQKRVAKCRRRPDGSLELCTFRFCKLRTMYTDAPQRFPDLYRYEYTPEEIARVAFKRESDPRVTRLGASLRRSTLDELPNLWHVMTGRMRLVGPRPEIPEMLPNYRPEQLRKFTVKPGVTGLAQINGRGRLTFQRTVGWDLEYVDRRTLWLDLKILMRTLWLVVRQDGAF